MNSMKYVIYKHIATVIEGERIDLEYGVKDENGEHSMLTLLQQLEMTKAGDEFITGNLQLASFTNFEIKDNKVIMTAPIEKEKVIKILSTILFIQKNGWTKLVGQEKVNPRIQRYSETKERIANLVNVDDVLSSIN